MMIAPSGRELSYFDLELIRDMNQFGFVKWYDEPQLLKSGERSHVYVCGREDLTDNPGFEWKVGQKLATTVADLMRGEWRQLQYLRDVCLIGIPNAGRPFAQAAVMTEYSRNGSNGSYKLFHREMRKNQKGHGANKGTWVSGKPDHEKHLYVAVDNVITSGVSTFEAGEKFDKDGYWNAKMGWIFFVDRQQGGIHTLERAGFHTYAVYNLLDITHALEKLDLWPRESVVKVEKEIKTHQFA